MKVIPVENEDTVFNVESRTVQCNKCFKLFPANSKVITDQSCPNCSGGKLKRIISHRVDIAVYFPIGECMCRGFQLQRRKEVVSMSPAMRMQLPFSEQERLRCPHIKVARCFALNRDIWRFELERLKKGNGAKEKNYG